MLIENGQIISGIICKNTVGPKHGGLLHITRAETDYNTTRLLYGNIQTLINNWILAQGVSIGIGDTIADSVQFPPPARPASLLSLAPLRTFFCNVQHPSLLNHYYYIHFEAV